MRPMIRVVAAGVLSLAVACSGGGKPGAPAGADGPDGAARAVKQAAGDALRRAQMQVGTDWVPGAMIAFCRGDSCTEDPAAEPERFPRAPASGLVGFVVARAPTLAEASFARRGRVVETATLHPGTYMATTATLRSGRYLVTLTARFGEQEGRWVFGLRVPR